MIRGGDFYEYVWVKLCDYVNVFFWQEWVFYYYFIINGVGVVINCVFYIGKYIFNSCMLFKFDFGVYFFFQYFVGWWIEIELFVFDFQKGYLMDFCILQKGSICFFYFLLIDEWCVLVEYIVFFFVCL